MDNELEILLAERYAIYRRGNNPDSIFGCWGFECGPGWLSLLVALADKLEMLGLDSANVRILQIKEKYWTLRAYIEVPGWADDEVEDFIDILEQRSAQICESCGEIKPAESNKHECDSNRLTLTYHKSKFIAH